MNESTTERAAGLKMLRHDLPRMSKKGAFGFVTQFVLVLGLICVGWGLDDLRGLLAQPARTAFLVLSLVSFVAAPAFGPILSSMLLPPPKSLVSFVAAPAFGVGLQPFRKGERPVGGQRWVLGGSVAFQVFLLWFLPFADRRGVLVFADNQALRYAGLVLAAAGGTVRGVALKTLSKQFSVYITLQKNHQLVQTGIYSLIRHPIYLGILLMLPGLALVFRSGLAVPVVAVALIFVLVRMRQEEELLRERFGAEFELYRGRTWRLLPYVY